MAQRSGGSRLWALLFLGLAYLLRAESSLRSGSEMPEHVQQHQHATASGGASLKLIDGATLATGSTTDDSTRSTQQQQQQQQQLRPTTSTSATNNNGGKTHFADEAVPGSENVTALVGQPAILLCRVKNLGNRTVSWMRKRDLHILTSMEHTFTNDARFKVIGNTGTSDDWNLRIDNVQPRDEGIYECQVNTEPKIHRAVYLRVLDVQAEILGQAEVYVKRGSTISLTCTVNSQGVPPSNVTWYHAGTVIDFDGPRGGVSLETEKSKTGTTSKLLITRALLTDSGNYSCVSSKAAQATVIVHVLD
ncbi:hypothetical protein QAD02_014838, partial [Eretmocerus hayati]